MHGPIVPGSIDSASRARSLADLERWEILGNNGYTEITNTSAWNGTGYNLQMGQRPKNERERKSRPRSFLSNPLPL